MADADQGADRHSAGPSGACPICHRPSDPVLRPFCSKRCADVDLHRWLAGTYRVQVEEEPDDSEESASPADPRPE